MSQCLVKSFGLAVRQQREMRQWSQEQLAETADLNRSYVGEIERGRVVVSLLTVEKLGRAFGISGAQLLEIGERLDCVVPANAIQLTAIAC